MMSPDINLSGLFLYLNADKKGVTLDLTDSGDRAPPRHPAGDGRYPGAQRRAARARRMPG